MDGRLQQPRHCCRVISSSGRLHPQCSTCTSNPGPRNSLKRTSSAVAYRSSNGTHPHVRLDARYLLPRHAKPNRYNTPACLATAAGNLGLEGQAAKCVADIDPGVYLDPSLNPEPFVGPIKVAHIPGGVTLLLTWVGRGGGVGRGRGGALVALSGVGKATEAACLCSLRKEGPVADWDG